MSNEKTTNAVLRLNNPEKSNLKKMGEISCGAETGNQRFGNICYPHRYSQYCCGYDAPEECTFYVSCHKDATEQNGEYAQQAGCRERSKPDKCSFFCTIISAFFNPMNAINIPIPAEIEYLRLVGMESKIISRTLKKVIMIKATPSISIIAKECCHE